VNTIDLFAGAGGLSEGFIQAGFNAVGHVEMDKHAVETLRTRMIYYELKKLGKLDIYEDYIQGRTTLQEIIEKYDLRKVADSVICEKIDENYRDIIKRLKKIADGKKIDIIVGGPPCQAYSNIGRARDSHGMRNDDRNFLYKYYVEFLKAFQPKIFVFENVPGLVSAGKGKYLKDMRALMAEAGYETDYAILNAADYGVPQNRRRVILIGWRKRSGIKIYPKPKPIERNYVVKDIFADLPPLSAGEGSEVSEKKSTSPLLEKLGISSKDFNLLLDHRTRPHNARDLEIYTHAVVLKNRGENLKYNNLPENLKTHKNQKSFLDRFKVVDLEALGSHTVVAHIGKDGHYYIHPDLKQNRSLSIREAARLQTFPDDYKFEGPRNSRYKQIGNAVPVLLAKKIAEEIYKYL
jgi:DNA (cytosine-5)-methyltransferase 1